MSFETFTSTSGKNEVLKDITNAARPAEAVVITGPSGSGKRMLLRTVNRLETIDNG